MNLLAILLAKIDVANGLFGAVLGIAFTVLGVALRGIVDLWQLRRVRRYWKPFIGSPLSVILTEYAVGEKVTEDSEIASAAGAGWLISKGSALALGELRDFAKGSLRLPSSLSVRGDRSGVIESENFIVIGSEANNRVAESAMDLVRERFEVPFELRWNEDQAVVEIHMDDGLVLSPSTIDGFGVDYAAVIKATISDIRPRTVMLISGCHMWGSHAAAEAVVSPDLIRQLGDQVGNAQGSAFIVRTRVVNGAATGPELTFDGHTMVTALRPLRR